MAPEAEVPSGLRAQVLALHEHAFGSGDAHDPALSPVSILLVDGDVVAAALDILSKELTHRGEQYQASGLSTVVTDPTRRNRGIGLELVRSAREQIAASGADLAVFTCDERLAPFYERAGFELLRGTQVIGGTPADPFPSGPLGKVTLAAFFTDHALAHRADFRSADIELYPGTIDRLW